MEAFIWLAGLTVFALGYLAARLEYNKKLPAIRSKCYDIGFADGVDDALKDVDAVRRAYQYYFQNRP